MQKRIKKCTQISEMHDGLKTQFLLRDKFLKNIWSERGITTQFVYRVMPEATFSLLLCRHNEQWCRVRTPTGLIFVFTYSSLHKSLQDISL